VYYRKGYFVSEQEERAAKAAALLQYEEQRQRIAVLETEANNIAKVLEGTATQLKNRPETFSFDALQLSTASERIAALIADLKATHVDVTRLRDALKRMGYNPRD